MTHEWDPERSLTDDFLAQEQARWDEAQRAREERALDHCEPDWKPPKRVTRALMVKDSAMRQWRETVLDRDQGCLVHSDPALCEPPFQAHHVVLAQTLRKEFPEATWNPLVGMGVCSLAHRQHHNRARPILFEEIPTVVVAYLREIGFGDWLQRHYPSREMAA